MSANAQYDESDDVEKDADDMLNTIETFVHKYGTQCLLATMLLYYERPRDNYIVPPYIQLLIADLKTALIHYQARYDDDRTRF